MILSAKDIDPPAPLHRRLKADTATFFEQVREMLSQCEDTSQHDRITILICACIDHGINRGTRITGVAAHLGFNKRFTGITLNEGLGRHWQRDATGAYYLLQ